MTQKHAAVEVRDQSGNQIRAVSQENDFPLPPVEELERLHGFRPDLVDKVVEMTAEEGRARRARLAKIDRNIFVQNLVSSIGAILVAIIAFGGSIFLAIHGHDMAAFGIVGVTLGTVVYAISKSGKN